MRFNADETEISFKRFAAVSVFCFSFISECATAFTLIAPSPRLRAAFSNQKCRATDQCNDTDVGTCSKQPVALAFVHINTAKADPRVIIAGWPPSRVTTAVPYRTDSSGSHQYCAGRPLLLYSDSRTCGAVTDPRNVTLWYGEVKLCDGRWGR